MNITALSSSLQCCCTLRYTTHKIESSRSQLVAERLLAVLSHAATHKHRLLHPTDTCRCLECIGAEDWVLRQSC